MKKITYVLMLCIFSISLIFLNSCHKEDFEKRSGSLDKNISNQLDLKFSNYEIVSIDTEKYFEQVSEKSASGTITLELDLPGIPINTFELEYDREAFEEKVYESHEFHYLKSLDDNDDSNYWFSFHEGIPLYANINLVYLGDGTYIPNYSIESLEDLVTVDREQLESLKDLYVVFEARDIIVDESTGCSDKDPEGNPYPIEEEEEEEEEEDDIIDGEEEARDCAGYKGTYKIHLYTGFHLQRSFGPGASSSSQMSQRAKAFTSDIAYGTRHVFRVEHNMNIEFRFSHEFGWFTHSTGPGVHAAIDKLASFRTSINGPNGKSLFHLVDNIKQGGVSPNAVGIAFVGNICGHPINRSPYSTQIDARNQTRRENLWIAGHEWGHTMRLGHRNGTLMNPSVNLSSHGLNCQQQWRIKGTWFNNCQ